MDKFLVIVESPTKAKTIRKFLPKNYIVEASMGHIRDLPQSASDIPKDLKKEEWAKIGVNVKKDFEPLYVIPKDKTKIVSELKKKIKDVDAIYLATDEDREGESISWHLIQTLKPKVPIKRMVFHEITKSAIQKALKETRTLDEKLVKAQEARRILDRLYGYTLSPLIWKKIAYGLSAGRVQSTGLKMIVARERERMAFKKGYYSDLKAFFEKSGISFNARWVSYQNKKIAQGKDFDPNTGKVTDKNILVVDEKLAETLQKKFKTQPFQITDIDEKEIESKPLQPFITSSLQMEGIRKLGLSAKETMRIAQKLYEEGLITYMRTDSPNLSIEAIEGARRNIQKLYGKEYLPEKPRQFAAKAKGAQEAHEAIRPAGEFLHPDDIGMEGREKALYELIWKRTMASQMKEAKKMSQSIRFKVDEAEFVANGSKIIFPGYLRVYVEGSDDPESALEDQEMILPNLKKGESLSAKDIKHDKHETKPPARFTEASLVQRLEKEGIGRPSTYASIIGTILDRGYVRKDGQQLIPTFTGMCVIQFLERYFENLVDYKFTSEMEDSLDSIAYGDVDWVEYLKKFYLGKSGLKTEVETQDKKIKPEESRTIVLNYGKENLEIKVGRFGPYIVRGEGKTEVHASIPEEIAPADLNLGDVEMILKQNADGPKPIGIDPKTKLPVFCLMGRYGAYVQLGKEEEGKDKPRRASIPKNIELKSLTLEDALKYLALPRELGMHPQTKKPVIVNNGRFGPYVLHDGVFRSLKKTDDVYTVGLERALEILAEEKKASSRASTMIREVGTHPKSKKKVALYNGKWGAYLKMGTKNIGLPEDLKKNEKLLEKLTIAEAVKIIDDMTKKK